VLLVACRHALLGTAVADDYSFLADLTFRRPLDWLDSMGATFYWRPLSRQLYFSLVGPWLLQAPGFDALLHGALLVAQALLLYRIARRFVPAPVAAAIAAFPLASEPARVLLGWPSGAQHLLAGTASLLAVHEALAGRLAIATLAALAGVLSHESAVLALPALPLAAWARTRQSGDVIRAAVAAGVVAALWATGYAVALGHGVHLPPRGSMGGLLGRLPGLYGRAVLAALNLEDMASPGREMFLTGYVALAVAAVASLAGRAARGRARSAWPALIAAGAWFVLGVLPLAALLPEWDAWRAWVPTFGFAVATIALLGLVSPWLAGGWIALKLAALLLAPTAPIAVSRVPSESGSHESFAQITRLQRLVAGTRRALLAHDPTLPRGATVCFVQIPRLAEYAFQGADALRVWYRDPTLGWDKFGGASGLKRRFGAGLEYLPDDPAVALPLELSAIVYYQRGLSAILDKQPRLADSLLVLAERNQPTRRGKFLGTTIYNRARLALKRDDLAAADSLYRVAESIGLEVEDHWAFAAYVALARGDRVAALKAARLLLAIAPNHPDARQLAAALGIR
jgi:hypothetical protein